MGTKISAEPAASDLAGAVILLGNQGSTTKSFALSLLDARFCLATDSRLEDAKRRIIAIKDVVTAESTTSGSPVDLTTTDDVSFTLAESANLLVCYLAMGKGSAALNMSNRLTWDGTDDSGTDQGVSIYTANALALSFLFYTKLSVGAGSHTAKVKHWVSGGAGTATWSQRLLWIERF